MFHDNPAVVAAKTRSLALIGVVIAAALSVLYARRRQRFVQHLVAAAHLWSFLMLLLLLEYALVPFAVRALLAFGLLHGVVQEGHFVTLSTEAILVVYSAVALRRVYRVAWLVAALQTAAILVVYTLAAGLLVGRIGIA